MTVLITRTITFGVLHCMGSEKKGLVQMVILWIYLINLGHVDSASSVVE